MSKVAGVYAQALYGLAKDNNLDRAVLSQMAVLSQCFAEEPKYIRLLSAANLSKAERCKILDQDFRGRVEPCLLNFMKILTEKGYIRYFSACYKAYRALYNEDNGILEVRAVTAAPLAQEQAERLQNKLADLTGKTIALENVVDAACMGGVRLDFDGKSVDGTVRHRLEDIRSILKNTVL